MDAEAAKQQATMLQKLMDQIKVMSDNVQLVSNSQDATNERVKEIVASTAEIRSKVATLEAQSAARDGDPVKSPVRLNSSVPGSVRKPHLVREQVLSSQRLTTAQKREELGLTDYKNFASSQLDVFREMLRSSQYAIFNAKATPEWMFSALEEYKNIAVTLTLSPSALMTFLSSTLPSSMEIIHWISVAKDEYGLESNGYAVIKLISDYLLSKKTHHSDSGGQLFSQELQISIRTYVDNLMLNIPIHVASNFDHRSDYFTRIVIGMQFGDHDDSKKDVALSVLENNFLSAINDDKRVPVKYHFELLLKLISDKLQLDEAKLNTPALVLAMSNPDGAALVTQALQALPSGMLGYKT